MLEGGRRVHSLRTNFDRNKPIITIITVVRNCEETIEETILSVINQNYQNIEYIIIDGMSTDNTLNIIKKYEKRVSHCVSESDKGIYDAMNKGIQLATGDWVNFMNAGDYFFNNSIISLVVSEIIKQNFDIIYGDFIALDNSTNTKLLVVARSIDSIVKGSVFSHQSCFIKSDVLKINNFDLKYKIAADYNQILSLYLSGKIFHHIELPLAIMTIDGLSYSNIDTYKEQAKIIHKYKPYSKYTLNFIFLISLYYFRLIIGPKGTGYIRKIKWKYIK